jgi:hypothetical protein
MPRLFALACVLAGMLSGCSEPDPHHLAGTWVCCVSTPDPDYRQLVLEFTPTGEFQLELQSYGEYGLTTADLTAYRRIEGTVEIIGDSMAFAPKREVDWDYGFGPNVPEIVQEPYSGPPVYDGAHFILADDRLTLQYTDHTNVLPMGITEEFTRVP